MAKHHKATKEQMREAIMQGMSYEQIAAAFGYINKTSAYSAAYKLGLSELYKRMKYKREERETNRLAELVATAENREEEPLFATENGRVVINNLHLILGEVEPYRKVIA